MTVTQPERPQDLTAHTTVTATGPGSARREVTMVRLIRSEWTKLWSVRSSPALLVATGLLILLPGLAIAGALAVGLDSLQPADRAAVRPMALVPSGVLLAQLTAGILGIVVMGGEYPSGGIRTTMIAAPRRRAVLLAKAVVVVVTVTLLSAMVTALTLVAAQPILARQDLDVPVGAGLLGTAIAISAALAVTALLGLALATILRRTTAAIVALILVLLVLPSLSGLIPGRVGDQVQRYLPSQALQRLVTAGPLRADQAGLDALSRRWAALNPALAAEGGFTVAVAGPGEVVAAAAGTDPNGRAIDAGDLSRVGSVTKTYVATALLRAQSAGLVDLDAPVSTYVSDVPGDPGVTVRMLLDHTSGLPEYVTGRALADAVTADPQRSWTLRDVLTLVPEGASQPGRWEYSNTNYVVAGLVLEAVTGTDWASAVQRLVLDPLGLTASAPAGEGRSILTGTIVEADVTIATDTGSYRALETLAGSAGSMVATAPDLALFGRHLAEGTALPPAQWQQMTAFGPAPGRYGLGLYDLGGIPETGLHAYGHDGAIPGYGAQLLLYPDSGVGLGVLVNDDRIDPAVIAADFAVELGIDDDPDRLSVTAAMALLLAYLAGFGGVAAWLLGRRDL